MSKLVRKIKDTTGLRKAVNNFCTKYNTKGIPRSKKDFPTLYIYSNGKWSLTKTPRKPTKAQKSKGEVYKVVYEAQVNYSPSYTKAKLKLRMNEFIKRANEHLEAYNIEKSIVDKVCGER